MRSVIKTGSTVRYIETGHITMHSRRKYVPSSSTLACLLILSAVFPAHATHANCAGPRTDPFMSWIFIHSPNSSAKAVSHSSVAVKSAKSQERKPTRGMSSPSTALPQSYSSEGQAKPEQDDATAAAWASALAAQDANTISRQVMLINKVGFLLIIFTLLATIWSAYASSRSVQIAQSVFESVNRPYLIIEYMDANFGFDSNPQNHLTVRFRIRNIGGAPAIIDTYGARLGFEELAYNDDWKNWLGGSNIFVIEKDGYSPFLQADAAVSDADFKRKLVAENRSLIWRVNFSYIDLAKRRRNVYFTEYYGAPPFSFFRSNVPPRVEEVDYRPYKWFQRRNEARSAFYSAKWRLLPWTKPKMP
jgi:hypothetical protein